VLSAGEECTEILLLPVLLAVLDALQAHLHRHHATLINVAVSAGYLALSRLNLGPLLRSFPIQVGLAILSIGLLPSSDISSPASAPFSFFKRHRLPSFSLCGPRSISHFPPPSLDRCLAPNARSIERPRPTSSALSSRRPLAAGPVTGI
jgi:hypothetical protein